MRFDKILLLGGNKIACDCTKHISTLLGRTDLEHITFSVLESAASQASMLKTLCHRLDIAYYCLTDKNEIEQFILDFVADDKTLIISANNRFIFTPKVIDKPFVEIINFHYALLPDYRGMNIPTWVIFNDEKKTGITWHFVTKDIDKGAIIVQKEIEIAPDSTALYITRKGMELAFSAFKEFIEILLYQKIEGKSLESVNDFVYKFSNLPLNALLIQNLDTKMVARFLRSFDYGGFDVIKKPHFVYANKCYKIGKYQIKEAQCLDSVFKIELKDGILSIIDSEYQITIELLEENDTMTKQEIINSLNMIKSTAKTTGGGVIANCYLLSLKDRQYTAFQSNRTIFFIDENDKIQRLYFFTLDFWDFAELFYKHLNKLSNEVLIDITSKDETYLQDNLCNMGFDSIAKQQRLSSNDAAFCFKPESKAFDFATLDSKDLQLCIAKEQDCRQIYKRLREVFDIKTSYFQAEHELLESIQNKQFFIRKDEDKIVSLLQACINPKSFYINQIFNFTTPQSIHGILKGAIANYTQNGGKYIYAWVDSKNHASQKFHAKYGLKHDGLWNVIYQFSRAKAIG